MKKFVAKTLDCALLDASNYFQCSLTQLDYEIIQNPSSGLFGLWKKEAIILASLKESHVEKVHLPKHSNTAYSHEDTTLSTHDACANGAHMQDVCAKDERPLCDENVKAEVFLQDSCKDDNAKLQGEEKLKSYSNLQTHTAPVAKHEDNNTFCAPQVFSSDTSLAYEDYKDEIHNQSSPHDTSLDSSERCKLDCALHDMFDDSFHNRDSEVSTSCATKKSRYSSLQIQNLNIHDICQKIEKELKALLAFLPLELDTVKVTPYDSHVLFVLINGADAALLIGQKGYRYKSLSYLIFNWVNMQYGYNIRLEIAQFLQNQEEAMKVYLEPIIEQAKNEGKAQTKPLDGVLTHVAIRILRESLPNKYIVFKEAEGGEKYITINDFLTPNPRHNVNGFGNLPKY